jgi:hypothetical protein
MAQSTEVATTKKVSLIAKMAAERDVAPADFHKTLTDTMFKGANDSQLMTLLLVADRYHLDVTTKEIYAFPAKGGGIVPVVSIDGWISLAHQHPAYDGEEFRYSDKLMTPAGGKACPEWMEIVIYRKDTSHPTVIREYLEECYRSTDPWRSHTKRMLRHKTMIQGYRVAFGFSGIKDPDEAERIAVEGTVAETPAVASSTADRARQALSPTPPTPEAQEAPETAPVAVDDVTGEVIDGEVVEEAPPGDLEMAEQEMEAEVEEMHEAAEQKKITRQTLAAIGAAFRNNGWSREAYELLLAGYGVADAKELTREQGLEVVRALMAGPEEVEDGD